MKNEDSLAIEKEAVEVKPEQPPKAVKPTAKKLVGFKVTERNGKVVKSEPIYS